MPSGFDMELQHANDTEMVFDDDPYLAQDDNEYSDNVTNPHARKPTREKPTAIDVAGLARGRNGSASPLLAGEGARRSPALANRMPGIAALMDAESEDLRDLGRKVPTLHINEKFKEQKRNQRTQQDARLDENRDYLYDAVERDRRRADRDKLRAERHEREMRQRSRYHKQVAQNDIALQQATDTHHQAMVARTNKLGTLIEELRGDVLEAQIGQQKAARRMEKRVQEHSDAVLWKFKLLLMFTIAQAIFVFLFYVLYYGIPAFKAWMWPSTVAAAETSAASASSSAGSPVPATPPAAGGEAGAAGAVAAAPTPTGVSAPQVASGTSPSPPSALDTSDDLSIGI